MAKRAASTKANKSALIQSALQRDPNLSPKALAEELNGQGVAVTPAYVSTIKTLFRKKGGSVRRRNGSPAGDMVSLAHLRQLKSLVDEIGGIEPTRELLNYLDDLT